MDCDSQHISKDIERENKRKRENANGKTKRKKANEIE